MLPAEVEVTHFYGTVHRYFKVHLRTEQYFWIFVFFGSIREKILDFLKTSGDNM